MRLQGSTNPGAFSIEEIPGTNLTLIRLYQNILPIIKEDSESFEYDEYHVRVQTWDGVAKNVEDNYDVFLQQGIKNEAIENNELCGEIKYKFDRIIQSI